MELILVNSIIYIRLMCLYFYMYMYMYNVHVHGHCTTHLLNNLSHDSIRNYKCYVVPGANTLLSLSLTYDGMHTNG